MICPRHVSHNTPEYLPSVRNDSSETWSTVTAHVKKNNDIGESHFLVGFSYATSCTVCTESRFYRIIVSFLWVPSDLRPICIYAHAQLYFVWPQRNIENGVFVIYHIMLIIIDDKQLYISMMAICIYAHAQLYIVWPKRKSSRSQCQAGEGEEVHEDSGRNWVKQPGHPMVRWVTSGLITGRLTGRHSCRSLSLSLSFSILLVYTNIYIYIYTHIIYMCIHIHIHMYICMCVCVCVDI